MNDILQRKLESIQGYSTRYEIAAFNTTDGRRLLLCYGPKSRDAIIRGVRKRADRVIKLTGSEEFGLIKGGIRCGSWEFKPTGRTQRESYIEGELDSIS